MKKSKPYYLYSLTLPLVAILAVVFILFVFRYVDIRPNDQSKILQSGTANIVVDHNSVDLFDQIPDQYLEGARNLKMVFSDRSVGGNINEGLNCFASASYAASPSSCRNSVSQADFQPDPVKYNRSNWRYEFKSGSWYELTRDFVTSLFPQNIAANDIVTYQFSYLNVTGTGSSTLQDESIDDPNCGFLATANRTNCGAYLRDWHVGRIQDLEAQNPGKKFIYWTTSLARSIGTNDSDNFNSLMRQWASNNRKTLFDVADILSHDPNGNPCYDNYGDGHLAICTNYTSETNGGHLGSMATGKIRVAKAFWVLMAQIAGWNPGGVSGPTATPRPTQTPTPMPSPTPRLTAVPTATSAPTPPTGGDDGITEPNLVYWLNFDDEGSFGSCVGCTRYNTTLTGGLVNNAFDFNGTSSYINAGVWDTVKGKSQFSLTVWIKPDFEENDAVRHYVFSDGTALMLSHMSYSINGFRSLLRTTSGSYRVDAKGLNWNPGEWHMIVLTYDGASFKIYWDGVLKGTSVANGVAFTDNEAAQIGMQSGYYWDGAIDELKIFNTVLTSSQIQNQFVARN